MVPRENKTMLVQNLEDKQRVLWYFPKWPYYSPYRSYQQFCHMDEEKGSFRIELTLKTLLPVVFKQKKMCLQAQLQ